jgi:hypothetical protein
VAAKSTNILHIKCFTNIALNKTCNRLKVEIRICMQRTRAYQQLPLLVNLAYSTIARTTHVRLTGGVLFDIRLTIGSSSRKTTDRMQSEYNRSPGGAIFVRSAIIKSLLGSSDTNDELGPLPWTVWSLFSGVSENSRRRAMKRLRVSGPACVSRRHVADVWFSVFARVRNMPAMPD